MTAQILARFLVVLTAHWLLAQTIPSGWFVPNLTLSGVVLWAARWPQLWWQVGLLAGGWTMVWAGRKPCEVLLSYLVVAAAMRLAQHHVDWSDRRLQEVSIIVACATLILSSLWLERIWSAPVLALALSHILLTALTVPLVRRLGAPFLTSREPRCERQAA